MDEKHDPSPTTAVLLIGDELLSGRTQDSNLGYIARFLAAYGIDVCETRIVGDREDEIARALQLCHHDGRYRSDP